VTPGRPFATAQGGGKAIQRESEELVRVEFPEDTGFYSVYSV
jgi:hypothetical protein